MQVKEAPPQHCNFIFYNNGIFDFVFLQIAVKLWDTSKISCNMHLTKEFQSNFRVFWWLFNVNPLKLKNHKYFYV